MVTRTRDGGTWPIGTDADGAWIAEGTSLGRAITAAIPAVFEAYTCTVTRPVAKAQVRSTLHGVGVLAAPELPRTRRSGGRGREGL